MKYRYRGHTNTVFVECWCVNSECIKAHLQHATMHIVNMRFGDNLHIHNKQGCIFTICIGSIYCTFITCIAHSELTITLNTWYNAHCEWVYWRYFAHSQHATLHIHNAHLLNVLHIHNMHHLIFWTVCMCLIIGEIPIMRSYKYWHCCICACLLWIYQSIFATCYDEHCELAFRW